ncbi:MAG: polysaccharide deacetylase family protein [Candidatus Gastranaerophilaceae bacterium]
MSEEKFIEIIKKINNTYNIISTEEFVLKWNLKKLSKEDVLITFDDCYKSVFVATDILVKMKIPALFFVSSDLVEKGFSWTDDIEKIIMHTKKKKFFFNKIKIDLSIEEKKFQYILVFKKYFQKIPNNFIEKKLRELAFICEVDPRKINEEKYRIISWKDLSILNSETLFQIGHHGHKHFPLSTFSSGSDLLDDINKNIDSLKQRLNVYPIFFAYPFGGKQSYKSTDKNFLKKKGFKFAFSTINSEINYNSNFSIPRKII